MRKKKDVLVEVQKPAESSDAPAAVAQEAPQADAPAQMQEDPPAVAEPAPKKHRKHATHPAAPEAKPDDKHKETMKIMAICAIAIVLLIVVLGFIYLSSNNFVPGNQVNESAFKDVFMAAPKVFIVMDIRGAQDNHTRNNIMQCGIDFAGSTPLGGKDVVPISIGDQECITPDGPEPISSCISELKGGLTIEISQVTPTTPEGARFFSNGMEVFIGSNYTANSCGFKTSNLTISG